MSLALTHFRLHKLYKTKPQMNTDEHGAAQPEPQKISPQRHEAKKIQTGKNVWDLCIFVMKTGCLRSQEDAKKSLPDREGFSA